MPVRKIPKNYIKVTGFFSSAKNGLTLGYESLLERDLMSKLEFDDLVSGFEEQPVRVPVFINGKKQKSYVPDILVHYRSSASFTHKPVLGEVKHTKDLKKNKAKYAPKFDAATHYAEERGWEFHIFTDKEIRTPLLENLKFLREYHNIDIDQSLLSRILTFMHGLKKSITVDALLTSLCASDDERLTIVPIVWNLVATKRISANLDKPLEMQTKLKLQSGEKS